MIAYSVSQRTTEMGLRMALGAGARDLTRLVVGNSMSFVTIGLVLGLGGALVFARYLSGQLFRVSALDPWVYVSVATVLLAAAFVASLLPARRATRVDPMDALRAE